MDHWLTAAFISFALFGLWGFFPKLAVQHIGLGSAIVYEVAGTLVVGLLALQLVDKLNPAWLPNAGNISTVFRKTAFDPTDEYTVPWQWGTTGIAYRQDKLAEAVGMYRSFVSDYPNDPETPYARYKIAKAEFTQSGASVLPGSRIGTGLRSGIWAHAGPARARASSRAFMAEM